MKNTAFGLAGALVIAALIAFTLSGTPAPGPADGGPTTAQPAAAQLPAEFDAGPSSDGAPAPAAFAHLPMNEERAVDVRMDDSTRQRLTPREQGDQLRDWLLFAVVRDAGLDADEINRALYDVPPVRHGHMRPVANFEYGPTRSCYIGDGRVVALVPECDDGQRKDHLAHVADEHRKNQGKKPARLLVVQYRLDVAAGSARLKRLADADGDSLFSDAYGYVEARVTGDKDFRKFMAAAEDVTFASLTDEGLTLGGRRHFAHKYLGIREEDVAALWQADHKIQGQWADLNRETQRRVDAFNHETRQQIDTVKARWDEKLRQAQAGLPVDTGMGGLGRPRPNPFLPESDDDRLKRLYPDLFPDTPKPSPLEEYVKRRDPGRFAGTGMTGGGRGVDVTPFQRGFDLEAAEVNARRDADWKKEEGGIKSWQAGEVARLRLVPGCGFSLDPHFDLEKLKAHFAKVVEPALKELAGQAEPPVTTAEVAAARQGLEDGDEGKLLALLFKLKKHPSPLAGLEGMILSEGLFDPALGLRFQAARYDGDLGGTEVGMVLFYTDLLNKLWAMNYEGGTPQGIADFRPETDIRLSPIYEKQYEEHSSTRIWFAPDERNYQLGAGRGQLFFARNATRLLSAASDSLRPRDEVPPGPTSELFDGWWNDHFEEVAAYEPQYERLNQVMKWSILIGWLDTQKVDPGTAGSRSARLVEGRDADESGSAGSLLSFLGKITVDRRAWFPEWVKKNDGLTFRHFDKVSFFEKGHKGQDTEAMPILASRETPTSVRGIMGGVSLANRDGLLKRVPLPEVIGRESSLSLHGLDAKGLQAGGGNRLITLRGVEHSFEAAVPGRSVMEAKPKPDVKLRGRYDELASAPIGRTLTRDAAGLTVESRAGATPLGSLRVEAGENGFKVAYQARDADLGQDLARDLSASREPPARFLASDARVEAVIRGEGDNLLVKLRGSEKWLKLARETTSSEDIARGFSARAADTTPGAPSYELAWVEPKGAANEVGTDGYLRLELAPVGDKRATIPVLARGPPAGGELPPGLRRVDFVSGESRFAGQADVRGEVVYVRVADLPARLRESPRELARLVTSSDLPAFREAISRGETAQLGRAAAEGKSPLIAALEAGDSAEAARLLAADPVGHRQALAEDLGPRRELIARYLEQGRPVDALGELDAALRVHPDDPELLLQKGLAEAGRGRVADALALKAAERPRGSPEPMLDMVNRLLDGPGLNAPQRRYLRAEGKALTARDLGARKKTVAEVKTVLIGDRPATEARLPDEPRLSPAKAADLPDDALLYLDDSAGLNNRDWSPQARKKTLEQAVEGGGVELYVVEQPDPVFRLTVDRVSAGPGTRPTTWTRPVPWTYAVPGSFGSPAAPPNWKDDDDWPPDAGAAPGDGVGPVKPKKARPVYLLKAKAGDRR